MELKDFEATLSRLEKIVSELEKGDQSLEVSLKLFEEGIKLAEFCSGKLDDADRKVQMLVKSRGKLEEREFEEDDSV